MKVLRTIALSIAVIIGSLFLISFTVCAFVPYVTTGGRLLSIFLALVDLAAIATGIRAIIKLNKRNDDNISIR
jgi:hypothetical protein